MAIRTIKDGTRALKGFKFIEPAIGRMGYYVWPGGVVPDEAGAGASNTYPYPIQNYIRYGKCFCAWPPNMMRRVNRKIVPIAQWQGRQYDGGIAAYWGSPVLNIGAGYFAGYMEDFNMERALRWAHDDRIPVLLGWKYTGVHVSNHGHVAILFPSGWILESAYGVGLRWVHWKNWPFRRYATVMVRGYNWIEYKGDEF